MRFGSEEHLRQLRAIEAAARGASMSEHTVTLRVEDFGRLRRALRLEMKRLRESCRREHGRVEDCAHQDELAELHRLYEEVSA